MTPDEVADIFGAANEVHETVTSKPTHTDTDEFGEIVIAFLVELIREHDGYEHGISCLS